MIKELAYRKDILVEGLIEVKNYLWRSIVDCEVHWIIKLSTIEWEACYRQRQSLSTCLNSFDPYYLFNMNNYCLAKHRFQTVRSTSMDPHRI